MTPLVTFVVWINIFQKINKKCIPSYALDKTILMMYKALIIYTLTGYSPLVGQLIEWKESFSIIYDMLRWKNKIVWVNTVLHQFILDFGQDDRWELCSVYQISINVVQYDKCKRLFSWTIVLPVSIQVNYI